MATNFRTFTNGVRLEPKTTSTVDRAGEMDFDTSANKFNAHNGTTSSPVVTESQTATLTNKTISGNTASNLVNGSGTTNFNSTGTITVPNATDTLVGKATTDTLTNKTLSGNTATNLVSGSGTFTFNTTGTITSPNATDTLVGKATTDTLTNKSISGSTNTITNVSLTTGVTGVLPLANGGTNKNMTAAAGGVVYTDSDSMEVTAAGTSGQFFKSNGSSAPAWTTFPAPTFQSFLSGTGTYTTPAGVLWIKVHVLGGGGGGGGGGDTGATNGTIGTASTFGGGTLITAAGGGPGATGNVGAGERGETGANTVGAVSATILNIVGSSGSVGGTNINATVTSVEIVGPRGADGPWGGAGTGRNGSTSYAGAANSGAGGGGGSATASNRLSGGSGAAGGYVVVQINAPSASYSYVVGGGGAGGSAGTGGRAAGAGGSGRILVEEFYC